MWKKFIETKKTHQITQPTKTLIFRWDCSQVDLSKIKICRKNLSTFSKTLVPFAIVELKHRYSFKVFWYKYRPLHVNWLHKLELDSRLAFPKIAFVISWLYLTRSDTLLGGWLYATPRNCTYLTWFLCKIREISQSWFQNEIRFLVETLSKKFSE